MPRLSLVPTIQTRELAFKRTGGGLVNALTDSYLINCYAETVVKNGAKSKVVVKRPGLGVSFTYGGGGVQNAQGTVFYKGLLFAMANNVLFRLQGGANASTDGSAWTASTNAPWTARTDFGCVVFQGQIIIMGGVTGLASGFLNDVWGSNDGVNWTLITNSAPWSKRAGMGLVVLGNTLYLVGGWGSGTYPNDVWSTTDGVNWSQVTTSAPWTARQGMGCVAFKQGILMMGGLPFGSGTRLNDVWFSPDGATWNQIVVNAGWTARQSFGCLVFNDKVWVFGGLNNAPTIVADVWSSIDGINWTNTGSMPAERDAIATTVYAGAMWLIGGNSNAATGTTTVWKTTDGAAFTVATAAYGGPQVEAASALAFDTPTAVSAFNFPTIWLFGGANAGGDLNQVYRGNLTVALPASFSPATGTATNDPWDFTTFNFGSYLIAKNTVDAWVFHAGALQKITSSNYPQATVAGVVNLDDTLYVMDPDGVLYGCNLADPFIWSALNFITADFESDPAVRVVKYGNYILVLKQQTSQFFQDAGRYPGSPLLPIQALNQRFGCASANSVVSMRNTVVWIARSDELGRFAVVMDGSSPKRLSDPSIERILDQWVPGTNDRATHLRVNGHDWYVLYMSSMSTTIIYDFQEDGWWIGTGFAITGYATDGASNFLQDVIQGIVYTVSPLLYQDNGASIPVTIQIARENFGTSNRKFCGKADVIGDQLCSVAPNNITLSWSDDDGQTFNSGRVIDMSKPTPWTSALGSFYSRVHKITHSSNNPLRLEAIDLELTGT